MLSWISDIFSSHVSNEMKQQKSEESKSFIWELTVLFGSHVHILHKKCCSLSLLSIDVTCDHCNELARYRSHLRVRFWTQFWQLTSNKPASRLFSLWTVFLGFNQHFVTVLKGSGLIVGAAHYCVLPVIFTRVGSKNSRRGLPGQMFDVGNTTQKNWRSLHYVSWDRPANSTT